ncbi:MAG: hypothetical protein GY855_03345, partial [candidate division Zixibacteria bacterium]|nr:hypothetical protein [candidate division Zixibacteria bacterium]
MMPRIMIFLLLLLISIWDYSYALDINVIYPKPESRIPSVDSTFIFGNTDPDAVLYINDNIIPVHNGGGFLGYIDVDDGDFIFQIEAIKDGDTASIEIPVKIGSESSKFLLDSLVINAGSMLPSMDMELPADETIKIGFNGTTNCMAFYSVDSVKWLPLYENRAETGNENSVFGDISKGAESFLSEYIGYCSLGSIADTIAAKLNYMLISLDGDSLITPASRSLKKLTPDVRIVEFTGKSEIVRTAHGAGYQLLYQPPGIRAVYDGYEGEYTRIKLSNSKTGFVPTDSIRTMPEGTPIPSSRIRFIKIEDRTKETIVKIPLAFKLPYRIEQELNPPRLILYIFGGIGDTDWIKNIPHGGAVRIAHWSQPEDNVYKLTMELTAGTHWGYYAGYDKNIFALHIKKGPKSRGIKNGSLNGLRIVLDPGHCSDLGAVGPTGLTEKEVNLWIAHKVRKLLESKGAEVIQTRYGYEPVGIYERPEIANNFKADILISIHNNALPDGTNPFLNNGTSTYYYHPQSKLLADKIQTRLTEKTGLPDFGVYYGNLALT